MIDYGQYLISVLTWMFLCRHSIQEMQEDETKTGNGNNLSEADQSIDNFVVTMVGL
jgi:hypothetical protein